MLFSRRKGFIPVKDTIQKEGMDEPLRHGLWNALHINIWEKIEYGHYSQTFESANLHQLFLDYWHNFFKLPLDNMPDRISRAHERVRSFFFEAAWYEVYDFIEFTAQNCPKNLQNSFIDFCNHILEKELSAYRLVDKRLTDITNEEEIESIESAINNKSKYSDVTDYLRTAIALLSDRKSPDYRNSVKESISAVESLCKVVANEPKATLGAAINKVEKDHSLHPAFKSALSNLYGFTNDSNGIRHALLDKSKVSYSDAKFMLVACSAFVNYVLGKMNEDS